jgi:hypothetical protein
MMPTLTAEYFTWQTGPWALLRFYATDARGHRYAVREEVIVKDKAKARTFAKRCRATPNF